MPMDLFVAYKLQKNVEKRLKEERGKPLGPIKNEPIKNEPIKNEPTVVKNDCPQCGQNWLWCMCDYYISM